ncbi:uncharacterized protein LOC122403957 [Colletes gigas]|uniref:uncharacterized protein LOC122403957 n=1 Tax=Colletes gigas TaxID=935657 RepID=UPI001C9B4C9A|nr:uncharacterized protein LOC122403957 [Colletes gigas]
MNAETDLAETQEQRAARVEAALAAAQAQLAALNVGRIDSYRTPKIPGFFRDDPALWFYQVEASFRTARVTDERTKADSIVAALDSEIIASFRDLITNSSLENPYTQIKERVLATYSASSESRLRKLLLGQVLTDGKPTQILIRLRSLDDGRCGEHVIRSIFMDQLPAQCRAILAAAKMPDLAEVAELADKIIEAMSGGANYAAPVSNAPARTLEAKVDKLAADLAKLSSDVERLVKDSRYRGRTRTPSQTNRNVKRGNAESSELCWAHRRFGSDARVCKGNCSWKEKADQGN